MDFEEGGTQELQQFVLLAQSAKGAACAALIRQVLSHPKIFVFGELLATANVQELAGTQHVLALSLLNTFAYGTWADLDPAIRATLEPPMALKLKQLTVVSMCASANVIAYDVLQRAVDIMTVRELEDLLISLMYLGLLRAKLDQRCKQIEVSHAIGRDVHPNELEQMAAKLKTWHESTVSLMDCLETQAKAYQAEKEVGTQRQKDLAKRIEAVSTKIAQGGHQQELGLGSSHNHGLFSDIDMMDEGMRHGRLGPRGLKGRHGGGGSGRRSQADPH